MREPEAAMAEALRGRAFGPSGPNGVAKGQAVQTLEGLALTKLERKIYAKLALHFGKWVPDEGLIASVYGDDPDGGPDDPMNSIEVTITRSREKLAKGGLKVEGARDAGVNALGFRLVWANGAPAVPTRVDEAKPAAAIATMPASAPRIPRALREGEVDLGRVTNGDVVGLDLSKLIEGRLLIQGNSGAGKSRLLRRLFEQAFGLVQQLLIDVDGEFSSLAENFDVAVLGAAEIVRVGGKALALHMREHRYSAVLDFSDAVAEERTALIADFADGLMEAPREFWHACLVLVDEVQAVVPRYDPGDVEPETRKRAIRALAELMGRGRKRGIGGIVATQRIAETSTPVVSKATNVIVGRTIFDRDLERAGRAIGYTVGAAGALSKLADGEFICIGPALAGPTRVRFRSGPVVSRHKGDAPKVVAPPAISAANATALLGQLPSIDSEGLAGEIPVRANGRRVRSRGWSDAEDQIVIAGYKAQLPIVDIQKQLIKAGHKPRAISGVSGRASALGLRSRNVKPDWTEAEDDIVRDAYVREVRIIDIVGLLAKAGYERGRVAVQMRAIALGITRDRVNYWTPPEKEIAIRGLTDGTPYREIVAQLRAAGYERGMTSILKFAQKNNFNRAGESWTPKQIEELQRLYAKKMPVKEIAAKLGKPISAVRTRASNLGLRQRTGWTDEEYKLLAKCHARGETLFRAAELIGRPYPNVAARASAMQLDFRRPIGEPRQKRRKSAARKKRKASRR